MAYDLNEKYVLQFNVTDIRAEIQDIQDGKSDLENNPIKRAPHTLDVVTADEWDRPYSRKEAAFPLVCFLERKREREGERERQKEEI